MTSNNPDSRPLRIGFVTAGLFFDPRQQQNQVRFEMFSRSTCGEIFAVVYQPDFQGYPLGRYRLHALVLPNWFGGYGLVRGLVRALGYSLFILGTAIRWRIAGQQPFDLLVASDPFKAGALARLAARILGIPFAVELNGNYAAAMALSDGTAPSWYVRVKAKLALGLMPGVLRQAAAIKLLYERQLGALESPELLCKTRVFHDLVPLEAFHPEASPEQYLLLLGHPWLLKGVDLAIEAFLRLSERYPALHLRIVGYCPNPARFEQLARGHPRIHLQPAGVEHTEAIGLVNRCFALLLPSRTEAMGRVLLEAMAAAKPVIGARVDGIPRVILPERNGLLFECGNAADLATQIERLLADPGLARMLGENGRADVHQRLSPSAYEAAYLRFLQSAAGLTVLEHAVP